MSRSPHLAVIRNFATLTTCVRRRRTHLKACNTELIHGHDKELQGNYRNLSFNPKGVQDGFCWRKLRVPASITLSTDDTQIYISYKANEVETTLQLLNDDLSSPFDWSMRNYLPLNPSKSKHIFIGNSYSLDKLNPACLPNIHINSISISNYSNVKNL